jgi:hypothetical protein
VGDLGEVVGGERESPGRRHLGRHREANRCAEVRPGDANLLVAGLEEEVGEDGEGLGIGGVADGGDGFGEVALDGDVHRRTP